MSLQRRYNIFDIETALQQLYYSLLRQVDYHFFSIFVHRF